jgi:hypothetical protein
MLPAAPSAQITLAAPMSGLTFLDPQGLAARAETAAMFVRFSKLK